MRGCRVVGRDNWLDQHRGVHTFCQPPVVDVNQSEV